MFSLIIILLKDFNNNPLSFEKLLVNPSIFTDAPQILAEDLPHIIEKG